MMLTEHQKTFITVCPECNMPIYLDEDTEKYIRTCDCRLTREEVEGEDAA